MNKGNAELIGSRNGYPTGWGMVDDGSRFGSIECARNGRRTTVVHR